MEIKLPLILQPDPAPSDGLDAIAAPLAALSEEVC
jgi:hypothetical protein